MSQKKVDQHKLEKKNRTKKIKLHRARQYALVIIGCAALGGAIGYPFGRFLYKNNYNKRKANATVEVAQYDYWFYKYWDSHISDRLGYKIIVPDDSVATNTDAN